MRPKKPQPRKHTWQSVIATLNRTPAPIAVVVGLVLGVCIARLWFGPVRPLSTTRYENVPDLENAFLDFGASYLIVFAA